ncbi:MAG TPA: glycosyltransferase 87 family protein [Candidatus Udaeobacter sp.]|nr:glycosyltransferase 87 family protein [Candidatus Udaeobacter sp.]
MEARSRRCPLQAPPRLLFWAEITSARRIISRAMHTAAVSTRRTALGNRGFRSVLLVIAGVPIALAYVWQGAVQPVLLGDLGDFTESYMPAAVRLSKGVDPYTLCATMGCLEPTGPQYVMPPVLAWMLQPLVGVDRVAVTVGVVLILNACLVAFVWLALRALRVTDRQLAVLLMLVALGFEPVAANVLEGQVNLVLLALSGAWLVAWVDDRWWGGAALGAAIALKLIQGPVALLILWGRRWSMLAAAAAAGLILWLAGAPQYLFEYLFRVLPAVSQGTGLFENHSPGGTITRLFDPNTFFAVRGSPVPARILTALVALAALAVTFYVLRSPAKGSRRRLLEAAAIVAVTPVVASYSWGTHLVLLLLPMFVLIDWSLRRSDWFVLGLVGWSWFCIGPAHKLMQQLLVTGYSDVAVLRVLAEAGVVGILCLWLATLVAVRRSPDDLDPADQQRPEQKEHHRARKDDPVAAVAVPSVEGID